MLVGTHAAVLRRRPTRRGAAAKTGSGGASTWRAKWAGNVYSTTSAVSPRIAPSQPAPWSLVAALAVKKKKRPQGGGPHARSSPRACACVHLRASACVCPQPTTPCSCACTGHVDRYWYSTIDVGECPPATLPFNQSLRHAGTRGGARPREETETETECYWEVQRRVRTITSECLLDRVRDAVVQHNSTCFRGCAQPSNITSTCFVDCFMSNVLGPRGGSALIVRHEPQALTILS